MYSNFKPSICLGCLARQILKLNTRSKTYYAALGVSHTATQKEIRNAYLELSKKVHPDQNTTSSSHDRFVEINEAYNTLSKASSRQEYDLSITSSARGQDPYFRRPGGSTSWPPHPRSGYRDSNDDYDNPYRHDPFSKQYYEYYHKQRSYSQPRPDTNPDNTDPRHLDAETAKSIRGMLYFCLVWMTFLFLLRSFFAISNRNYIKVQHEKQLMKTRAGRGDKTS